MLIIENSLNKQIMQNMWFWLSLLEAITIVILLYRKKSSIEDIAFKEAIKSSIQEDKISMGGIVNNIFKSKELYDELKVKCHPDKFLDIDKNVIANELFQKIVRNKTNYDALCNLKQRAVKELNINQS